jgi:hypothetical protein
MVICFPAYTKGNEEMTAEPLNKEWALCITSFDVSSLSSSRRLMGDVILRDITASLKKVKTRYRKDGELSYYQDYAWSKSRSGAAKTLADKRNERDMLLYQGDPGWKYKKNLKARQEEIVKLEEALLKAENNAPYISERPLFKLIEANTGGAFPAPPQRGAEYKFCMDQKVDAFLAGQISEYHGRILLRLQLYTLYSRSYSYADETIFSSEDISTAVREIGSRLAAEVSETAPAVLVFHVKPENAITLVNGAYAGRGEIPEAEYSPGTSEIDVFAGDHLSTRISLDLSPASIHDIYINLTPAALSSLIIDVPEQAGSSVYLGSLYLGATPLRVNLPYSSFAYLSVETPGGETGQAVYREDSVIRGSAEFISPRAGAEKSMVYETSSPVDPGEKRVDTARRKFYGAYGRFWIALPLSMLVMGMADNYIEAQPYSGSMDMYDKATNASYFRTGAYALIGITAVDVLFRLVRYLYVSGADSVPIARFKPGSDDK